MFLSGCLFEQGSYYTERSACCPLPPHPAAPLMMNQVDVELGYSGRPMLKQEPAAVTEDDISGADLVNPAEHSLTHAPHTFAI